MKPSTHASTLATAVLLTLTAFSGLFGRHPELRSAPVGTAAAAEASVFSAKIEGRQWVAVRGDGMLTTGSRPVLVITGLLAGEGRTPSMFGFTFVPDNGNFERKYVLKRSDATALTTSGRFTTNLRTENELEDQYVFESGEAVIEKFDAENETVSGTFSGVLRNRAGSRSLDVTEGRFANVRFSRRS